MQKNESGILSAIVKSVEKGEKYLTQKVNQELLNVEVGLVESSGEDI